MKISSSHDLSKTTIALTFNAVSLNVASSYMKTSFFLCGGFGGFVPMYDHLLRNLCPVVLAAALSSSLLLDSDDDDDLLFKDVSM